MNNEIGEESLRDRIRRVVRNKNRSSAASKFDTSDVIQDANLQMWLDGLISIQEDHSQLDQALVATIAKGHLSKNLRKHAASKRNPSKEQPLDGDVTSMAPDPSTGLEEQEQIDNLLSALNLLTPEDNDIVFRRYFCDVPVKQIADCFDGPQTKNLSRQHLLPRSEPW